MSDPENFVARWSRRKRAAAARADEETSDEKKSNEKTSEECKPTATSDAASKRSDATLPSELPFDLAKLPPIESITAESDIRAFLAPGVPAELSRAALRRAWSADPKIRDFVGLADYDWDFNTPGAIAGFGPLEMTDELRRQVAEMVGRSLAAEAPERPAAAPAASQNRQASVETSGSSIASTEASDADGGTLMEPVQSNTAKTQVQLIRKGNDPYNSAMSRPGDEEGIATHHNLEKPDNDQLITKRLHGRALPK